MSYFGNQPVVDELQSGELIQAVEVLQMAINSLNRSIGQILPNALGQLRVSIDAGTLPTVSAVTTVSTLNNQTSIGGNSAFEHIPALMRLSVDQIRSNITVS